MLPLADAAICRSESDWLVGINGTRAMTAFNSKSGGFHLTTVGRVQTPTLAILVEREEKIKKFVAARFLRSSRHLRRARRGLSRTLVRREIQEGGKRTGSRQTIARRPAIASARRGGTAGGGPRLALGGTPLCHPPVASRNRRRDPTKMPGQTGLVEMDEKKPSTSAPPPLYDLTSLQRDANGRFGFSAKSTLGLAQALYERHKVLTYPRTDSRALPEDYIPHRQNDAGGIERFELRGLCQPDFAQRLGQARTSAFSTTPRSPITSPSSPRPVAPKHLSEPEQKLYDLVTKRFLAMFYPAAEFLITTRITRVEGEPFKSEGKVMVKAGWLEVYGKEAQSG